MENKKKLILKEATQKENRIWVRIASACNNICIFCLDSDAQNGTFPEEEKIKHEIRVGYIKGYENRIIISGGEASINPKFSNYIAYAKEVGYNKIQTVTNGNMFFSEEFCKKVFKAGLEEVTFSFHGHNSTLHDYLVATPGAFKKSLKGLIYVKKNFPDIIVNIDIVVNKVNVKYLHDIVSFFMKLGVYEYDILQIVPFGRGFSKYKKQLFYNIEDYSQELTNTWKLSTINGMYMWTNRFPAEAFEGYEDLIQDPRKVKGEVMGEGINMFSKFIKTKGLSKPNCFGDACNVCFIKQYCHNFINNVNRPSLNYNKDNTFILRGEEFPSEVYKKYGESKENFLEFLHGKKMKNIKLINVPKCLGGEGLFEKYNDLNPEYEINDYTKKYIKNLYRKKSLRCNKCRYNETCEGIGINFIRSYGFNILKPII